MLYDANLHTILIALEPSKCALNSCQSIYYKIKQIKCSVCISLQNHNVLAYAEYPWTGKKQRFVAPKTVNSKAFTCLNLVHQGNVSIEEHSVLQERCTMFLTVDLNFKTEVTHLYRYLKIFWKYCIFFKRETLYCRMAIKKYLFVNNGQYCIYETKNYI